VTFLKGRGLKLIAERHQSELFLEEVIDLQDVKRQRLDKLEWLEDVPTEKLLRLCQEVNARAHSFSSPHNDDGQELLSPANTQHDDLDSSYLSGADTNFDSDSEDRSSVVLATRNTGERDDFQQHMKGFIHDFLTNSRFKDVDTEWETFDVALGDVASNKWTLCMLLWVEFAAKAFDLSLRDKWRKTCNNAPSQEILLSNFNQYLLDPATSPELWGGDEFKTSACGKQYGACIFFTLSEVSRRTCMQKEAKQKWVDVVVNGWLSDDEPASEFLSRANTFLRQYGIDTMNVFESVVKTQSYVAFMQMPSLTASLPFGYLESCKLAHVSSGSAVGSRTFLHGFSSFVSSAGRVFRMNNADMPARSAVPTIVEGLRCLAHLRDHNCEMLGPVMTVRALLHADSLHVLSAPAHASTVHFILRGLTRIMRDSSSLEIGDYYFLASTANPALATPLEKDIAANLHTSAFLDGDSSEGMARPHRDSNSEISVEYNSSNDDVTVMVYSNKSGATEWASCAEFLERFVR